MNKLIIYIISSIVICSSFVDLTNHNTQIDPLEPSDYNKVSLYIGDKPIYKPFVIETGYIDEGLESSNQCNGSLIDISYLFLIAIGLFAIRIALISIEKQTGSAPIGENDDSGGSNSLYSGQGCIDNLESDYFCSSGIDSESCDSSGSDSDCPSPTGYDLNCGGPIEINPSDESIQSTNSSSILNSVDNNNSVQQINNNHNINNQVNNNNNSNNTNKCYNNNYKSNIKPKYKKYNYFNNKRKTKLTSAKYINNYE